jgi:hypothetical protein
MPKKTVRCTFCATGIATTRDHIPPRCFFPEKLPSRPEPITVPCCRACHLESQRSDGTIRNLLISVEDTESAPVVQQHLITKRDKSFSVDRKEMPRLMSMMREADRTSAGGIYLGKDLAFTFDTPLMHSFVRRMCRGLLRAEFGLNYFEADIGWRLNVQQPDAVYYGLVKFGRVRVLHEVFAYAVTEPKENKPGWVILNFYRRLEIFARVMQQSVGTLAA